MQVSTINRADLKKYVPKLPEEKLAPNKNEDAQATLIPEAQLQPLISLLHIIYTQLNV